MEFMFVKQFPILFFSLWTFGLCKLHVGNSILCKYIYNKQRVPQIQVQSRAALRATQIYVWYILIYIYIYFYNEVQVQQLLLLLCPIPLASACCRCCCCEFMSCPWSSERERNVAKNNVRPTKPQIQQSAHLSSAVEWVTRSGDEVANGGSRGRWVSSLQFHFSNNDIQFCTTKMFCGFDAEIENVTTT